MAPSARDADRAQFAEELRAMRKQAGMSRDELGARIGYSASTIGMIETQHRKATPDQAARLDVAFGLPGTFARIEERQRGIPFSAGFRPFQPYEAEARSLKLFEHSLIPGLLQTEAYARTVSEAYPDATPEEVDERVSGRLTRQDILTREDPPPPRLWVVLDQNVLCRNVGGPKVMHGQLVHLAEMARRPRVSVQVIPYDRPHPGLLGAFAIAEMSESPAIVYLETATDGLTDEDPETAEAITLRFDALRTEALTGGASLILIEEAAQRWKETTLPPGVNPASAAATVETA
jgi:transcriptional regulator with XRE-family HTH domain